MDIRLIWLAVGTFAIGVESFAISSLLPQISQSTGVTLTQAGYLVVVFSLTTAFGGPVLAALTGTIDRRRTLTLAALVFAAGAIWAALSHGYFELMAARVLMAFAAGLYSPTAQATGVAIVSPDHRARAISIIIGGTTMAVAFGAPIGAVLGGLVGWRGTYFMVAGLGVVAALSLWFMLPAGLRGVSLSVRQRLAAIALPGVAPALLTTWLYMTGGFTVLIYIAAISTQTIGLPSTLVPAVMLAFGIGAAIGNLGGGQLGDRFGPGRTIISSLVLGTALLFVISGVQYLPSAWVAPAFFILMFVWGVVAWGFVPPQSSHLLSLSPANAPLVLSLNASALYLGIAAGSFFGGLVLQFGSVGDLGWVGALFPLAALVLIAVRSQTPARRPALSRMG